MCELFERMSVLLGTPVFMQWEDYPQTNILTSSGAAYPGSSVQGEYCSPTPPSRRPLAKSSSVTSSKSKFRLGKSFFPDLCSKLVKCCLPIL